MDVAGIHLESGSSACPPHLWVLLLLPFPPTLVWQQGMEGQVKGVDREPQGHGCMSSTMFCFLKEKRLQHH